MASMKQKRAEMVKTHLIPRGITDEKVIHAMETVPREYFIPPDMKELAYADGPLPIEENQTISQPYIVALMIQEMEPETKDSALDIGTGSGYAAAVLSRVVKEVYTIERHEKLVKKAKKRFSGLGYNNIHVVLGDGTLGLPEHSPYHEIVVTAGSPSIPSQLTDQLADGGRLVIPVGANINLQELIRIRRINKNDILREKICDVRFVPLIGKAGWGRQNN